MTINTALKAIAGKTAPANNPTNAPGKPTMKYAEVKKTVPEIIVPIPVRTAALTTDPLNFFSTKSKP